MTRNDAVPADLPSEDIRVDIALDRCAAQALAAYQWLQIVRDRFGLLYAQDIVPMLRDDATPMTPPSAGANDPPS